MLKSNTYRDNLSGLDTTLSLVLSPLHWPAEVSELGIPHSLILD